MQFDPALYDLLTDAEKAEIDTLLLADIKEACEKPHGGLREFVRYMWPVVEPAIPLVWGIHLDIVCSHLEAVTNGDIKRLLINIPPGHSKSILVDVFWPAFEWGPRNMPSMRYIAASYSEDITMRDNMRFRDLIRSNRFQSFWGDRFAIRADQDSKMRIGNDKTGWKIATSVGGVGTGERGSRVLVDDPQNIKDAESDAIRANTLQWWREVVPTRLNDPATSAIVVIMQRVHEDDVSGDIIKRNLGYDHLCLPAIFEADRPRIPTSIGFVDPRTEDGELLWPERFNDEILADLKNAIGKYAFAGQFQQSPSPRGGGLIKEADWQIWPPANQEAQWMKDGMLQFPVMEYIIAAFDGAYTEKQENDYSALVVLGVFRGDDGNPKIMLMTCWQARLTLNDAVNKIAATCRKFKIDKLIVEAKATGISVAQEIRRIHGVEEWPVELFNPKGDKVARAYSVQHLFEEKIIYAPDREWADLMISTASKFPKGAHDDLCFVAGTMIATRRGDVKIENITIDDFVLTPDGWRSVRSCGPTGLYPVITKFGLTGTAKHPVFTLDSSYQPMEYVTHRSLLVRLSLCGLIQTALLRSLNSMEGYSSGWEDSVNTIYRNQQKIPGGKVLSACMSQFGKNIQERKLKKAFTFITKMAIHSIMILTILSRYRFKIMVASLRKSIQKNKKNIWTAFDLLRSDGMRQKRDENGIKNIGKSLYRKLLSSAKWFAQCVKKNLLPKIIPPMYGFVPTNVGPDMITESDLIIVDQEWRTAQYAEQNFSQKLSKEPNTAEQNVLEKAIVYNMAVEGANCYFANGILVHNCDAIFMGLIHLRSTGWALRRAERAAATADIGSYASIKAENEPLPYDV